jgi:hypothetical protein
VYPGHYGQSVAVAEPQPEPPWNGQHATTHVAPEARVVDAVDPLSVVVFVPLTKGRGGVPISKLEPLAVALSVAPAATHTCVVTVVPAEGTASAVPATVRSHHPR